MKHSYIILLLAIFSSCNNHTNSPSNAEVKLSPQPDNYSYHTLHSDSDTLPYRLLLPKNYDKNKKYPLLLFLHGAGERGRDNDIQLVHCSSHFLQDSIREKYPAIIVFPQCQKDSTWNTADYNWTDKGYKMTYFPTTQPNTYQRLLQKLLIELKQNYSLDKSRFYLAGLSMGGIGTFEFVKNNPNTFAAAVPICGGAHPDIAPQLTGTSWWIFHGEDDDVIPVSNSLEIYEAMKKTTAEVKLTVYPKVKHDSWNKTIIEPELLPWMFSKSI